MILKQGIQSELMNSAVLDTLKLNSLQIKFQSRPYAIALFHA